MIKLVYVGFSFNHHGLKSGYDQISSHLNYDKYVVCQKDYDFLQYIINSVSFFSKIYVKLFGFRLWWVEFKLILISLLNPDKFVFHIIYGENIFKFLRYFKCGNKIVLTLHQPPSYYEEQAQMDFLNHLKYVDKLIVMSEDMELYFKLKFPEVDVLFIPHGIDTLFFKPKEFKKNQILLIGNWLRDFEFASKVFFHLESLMPEAVIKIVTNKENHIYFTANNVECLSGISDDSLLDLYQTSKIVFLPLVQFTANNALLEALSCGCKVVISSDSYINYKSDNNSVLSINCDVDLAVNTLKHVCENWSTSDVMNSRSFIEDNYSWELISDRTKRFLVEL